MDQEMRREIRKYFQLHNNENVKICGIQLKQYLKVNLYVYDYISKKIFKKNQCSGLPWCPVANTCTPDAGGQGAIPSQASRSHIPQLRPVVAK